MPERAESVVQRAAKRNAKGAPRQQGGRASADTKGNSQGGRRRKAHEGENGAMKGRASEKRKDVVRATRPAKTTLGGMAKAGCGAPRIKPHRPKVDQKKGRTKERRASKQSTAQVA